MSDSGKHESEDLEDYTVLDANDTLDGNPGDDPLDRGVVTPDRWSAGVQYALKGEEESESLDELLAEEEPDDTVDPDEDDEESLDENATGGDVTRFARDDVADVRSGRLVATDQNTTMTWPTTRRTSSSPATPGSTAAGRARRKRRSTSSTTLTTTSTRMRSSPGRPD
jgi:hypothetical protein